jgi:hypothetical protein
VKKPDSVYIVLLLVLVLVGCTGPPPKPVKPVRPVWIENVPGEAEGKMSFVGVSTFFSTEQSARDNACEVATNHAVKYISTDARGKVERLAKTFGLKGDRINETISGRSFQEQLFGGVTRRLKCRIWHLESKYDAEKEVAYKYFVLAEIPTVELDYAIEEAVQKAAEEEQIKKQAILDSEVMLTKRLRSAKTLARQGNLLSALKQLQELKSMAPKQPTMKRDLFITDARELEAQWLGSVDLIAHSGNEQYLEPGQTPGPLKVQVVMQPDNDTLAVRNFPVVFMSKQTKDVPILTDPNGVATLQLPPLNSTGILTFVAIPDPKSLQNQLPEAISNNLVRHKASFKLEISVPFLKQRIKNDFMLKLSSNITGNYILGKKAKVSGSCEKRCRVRIYSWDGTTGELEKETGTRKWIKNKTYTLISFVPNEVGKFTLIALSTTGKFPDTVKEGTTYTATEFEMVLNSLRNMNTAKAEEHLEFTIKGN